MEKTRRGSDMIETAWNTGNLYTKYGQRIGAVTDGKTVWFADIDRGIDGQYPDSPTNQRELAESVTAHYLRGDRYALPEEPDGKEIRRCRALAGDPQLAPPLK
jgi:hypothetical protein